MSSSTPRRFVLVPPMPAYEIMNCWQCPHQSMIDLGYGEYETVCGHVRLDIPRVGDHGIPDWCPIKQEE